MVRLVLLLLLVAANAEAQVTPTPMQAKPKAEFVPKEEPAPTNTAPLPEKFPVTRVQKNAPLPSLQGARRCEMTTTPVSDILRCDNGLFVIMIR